MPAYFGLGNKNSDSVSDRYLHINNCGFCEDMDKTAVSRPTGRKDYQLIYIKSGTIAFGKQYDQLLGEGYVYLYTPGTPQYYRIQGAPTTFYWIHFTGSALPVMLQQSVSGSVFVGEFPEFERFCKDFYMDHRISDSTNGLYYEGLLVCLLARLSEKGTKNGHPHHRRLTPALLAMNQNIALRLSNEELAQLCGLNRYYFIKLFKKVTGQTPQQYYTQQAIEAAQSLLENTDHTIGQIAALCGIDDSFYFSRVFKKHTGVCPADYRKNIRH